jgi:hypothetical protein
MSNTCLPGLQGFPIQISGWTSEVESEREKFKIPNDISLQFSPSAVPMNYLSDQGTFQIQGTNTFFMGGTQFIVRMVRISVSKQEGLSLNRSTLPYMELHIWGVPVHTATNQNQIALLDIPVWEGPMTTPAGNALLNAKRGNATSLEALIPSGTDLYNYPADVMRYTTCVETDASNSINITVAYWMNGMVIVQDQINKVFPRPLPMYGIPMFGSYKFLSTYERTESGKGNRRYNTEKGMSIPYSTSVVLSVATAEVRNGFRFISNFVNVQTARARGLPSVQGMKCIKVDRKRDIKNGKLIIDPATGQRLEDMDKEAQDASEVDIPSTTTSTRKIMETIFIILGIILGCSMLGFVLYLIYYNFVTRKSVGEIPTPDNIEELAAALGPQAGK